MSTNPKQESLSGSCGFARLTAFTVAFGTLLLIACPGVLMAGEQKRWRVDLEFLQCDEESDEIGSDDPYLVMAGVNLRTGKVRTVHRGFRDVSTDDDRRVAPGKATVFDDWVDRPDDVVVLVALLEFDREFNTGYVTTESGLVRGAVVARVSKDAAYTASKYAKAYRQGVFSRNVIVKELLDSIRTAANAARAGDELLGVGQFGLTANSWTPNLRMTGDGADYTVYFRNQVLETRQTSIKLVSKVVIPNSDPQGLRPPNLAGLDALSAAKNRWVYTAFPFIEYRRDVTDRTLWRELQNGATNFTFRETSASGPYVQLKDNVRAVWLRLYANKSEISKDGVTFTPWFPGAWK